MSISFKFDNLIFTSDMSVSEVARRKRIFMSMENSNQWFEMYLCRGSTPTIVFDFGSGVDGSIPLNMYRFFDMFKHTFREFVKSAHKWFSYELSCSGLPTCKIHPDNDLNVIGMKTRRYVNGDELVLEWLDDVAH